MLPQDVLMSENLLLPALAPLHGLLCGFLCHCRPLWAGGTQPASPSQATRESLLWHLDHLLPAFFTDLSVCGAASLIFSHYTFSQLVSSIFHLFLSTLSQRHHQHRWWAQLWPVAGPLEPTETGCVQCSVSSQKPALQLSKLCHVNPVQEDSLFSTMVLDRTSNMCLNCKKGDTC